MVRDVGVKVPYGTDKLWDAELPDGQAQALFHCAPAAEIGAFVANLDLIAHPANTCVIAMKQGSA